MLQTPPRHSTPAPKGEYGRHRSYPLVGGNRVRAASGIIVTLAIVVTAGVLLMLPENTTDEPATVPASIAHGVDPTAWVSPGSAQNSAGAVAAGAPAAAPSTAPAAASVIAAQQGTSAVCGLAGGEFRLTVAPEIAAAVQQVWADTVQSGTACSLGLTPQDSAQAAASIAGSGADAWLPDSSYWAGSVAGEATPVSVASSPIVLAVTPAAAQAVAGPSFTGVLDSRLTATPIRVGLPDPSQSIPAAAALLALRAGLTGAADQKAALTWAMRSTPAGLPVDQAAALGQLAAQPGVAMPVTEQAVYAYNAAAGGAAAQALYPDAAVGYSMDYPLLTLDDSADASGLTADLVSALQTDAGREALQAAGFRTPDAAAAALAVPGVDGSRSVNPHSPTASDVQAINAAIALSNEPSRLLAVMDVSGSMAGVVPGSGGATRMDLARAAATRGLGLYPADSEIGLWTFSRKIDGATDYRQVVPVGLLSAESGGVTGQQQIAGALQQIQVVPDGGTGLYDTTLAAVRTMQQSWDPNRVNTVLLLTDGQNDDQGSITLDQLLTTLQAEQDPTRPVQVIAIGFGPDTDTAALSAITSATGGATYVSADPRDIGEIFLDAVGRRLCMPNC